MKTSTIQNKIIIAALWLLIWQLAYKAVGRDLFLVSPLAVLKEVAFLAAESSFWTTVGMSFLRIMTGYSAALVLGCALATLSSASRFIYDFLFLPISVIKATPVVSFILLAIIWLKTWRVPSFISFLMALPVIYGNVHKGISETDKGLLEMAESFDFNITKKIKLIYIPSVFPYFTASAITSLGLAWKAGIAAEVISVPSSSIGKELYNSKIYLETPRLFAWTFIVIVLSVIIEKILTLALKRYGYGRAVK